MRWSNRKSVDDLASGETFLVLDIDGRILWSDYWHMDRHGVLRLATFIERVDERLHVLVDGNRYSTTILRHGVSVVAIPPHHPVCADCGEVWPCRDERTAVAAQRLTATLDDMCAHCGQPIGGAWSTTVSDGLTRKRFHEAKKYRHDGVRCVDAAAKAAAEISGVTP